MGAKVRRGWVGTEAGGALANRNRTQMRSWPLMAGDEKARPKLQAPPSKAASKRTDIRMSRGKWEQWPERRKKPGQGAVTAADEGAWPSVQWGQESRETRLKVC